MQRFRCGKKEWRQGLPQSVTLGMCPLPYRGTTTGTIVIHCRDWQLTGHLLGSIIYLGI